MSRFTGHTSRPRPRLAVIARSPRDGHEGDRGGVLVTVRERHPDLADPGPRRGVRDGTGQADRGSAARIIDDLDGPPGNGPSPRRRQRLDDGLLGGEPYREVTARHRLAR